MKAELQEGIEKAARLVLKAKHTVALVGAGMSVESGIPPFRGPGGLWTKYGEPPMNSYDLFLQNPRGWWEERVAKTGLYAELNVALAKAKPNPGHYALAELEAMGLLKAIITQNVDNLHFTAGSREVLEIHGNNFKLRCIACNTRFPKEAFTLEELPPHCPRCKGLVKFDTVTFGEPIPLDVMERCQEETYKCDCMLILGTSATVYPAAGFPSFAQSRGASLIEVNPDSTPFTAYCEVVLRGPSGVVMPQLVQRVKALSLGGKEA